VARSRRPVGGEDRQSLPLLAGTPRIPVRPRELTARSQPDATEEVLPHLLSSIAWPSNSNAVGRRSLAVPARFQGPETPFQARETSFQAREPSFQGFETRFGRLETRF